MTAIDEKTAHLCLRDESDKCHIEVSGDFSDVSLLIYIFMKEIEMGYEVVKFAIDQYENKLKDESKKR